MMLRKLGVALGVLICTSLTASLLACSKSDETAARFNGITYTGTIKGQKSGTFSITVNDDYGNFTGSATIQSNEYPITGGVLANGNATLSIEKLVTGNSVLASVSGNGFVTTSSFDGSWWGTLPQNTNSGPSQTSDYQGILSGTASSDSGDSGTGDPSQCTFSNYDGPTSANDEQAVVFCQNAYINECLDEATGTDTYASQTESVCEIMGGILSGTTPRAFCKYCP